MTAVALKKIPRGMQSIDWQTMQCLCHSALESDSTSTQLNSVKHASKLRPSAYQANSDPRIIMPFFQIQIVAFGKREGSARLLIKHAEYNGIYKRG